MRTAEAEERAAWIRLATVCGRPDFAPVPRADDLEEVTALAEILARSPKLRFAQAEVTRDRIGLE